MKYKGHKDKKIKQTLRSLCYLCLPAHPVKRGLRRGVASCMFKFKRFI